MKATFPVREFPWVTHAGAVLFVLIAVAVTMDVYASLPDRLATTFDFQNNPMGYMNKATYVSIILGYMIVMTVALLAMDRLYFYPVFPVPLMSAISGSIQLFTLLMHLLILDIHIMPEMSVIWTIVVLCALPLVYVVVHFIIFRGDTDDVYRGAPLWTDNPPQSWLTMVFFFVRPILPHEVMAYRDGLVLHATAYRFMIPWAQIRSIEHATAGEAMSKMAVRVSSSPSRSVKLYLSDQKMPVIFSIDNEARLIAEWEKHRSD